MMIMMMMLMITMMMHTYICVYINVYVCNVCVNLFVRIICAFLENKELQSFHVLIHICTHIPSLKNT